MVMPLSNRVVVTLEASDDLDVDELKRVAQERDWGVTEEGDRVLVWLYIRHASQRASLRTAQEFVEDAVMHRVPGVRIREAAVVRTVGEHSKAAVAVWKPAMEIPGWRLWRKTGFFDQPLQVRRHLRANWNLEGQRVPGLRVGRLADWGSDHTLREVPLVKPRARAGSWVKETAFEITCYALFVMVCLGGAAAIAAHEQPVWLLVLETLAVAAVAYVAGIPVRRQWGQPRMALAGASLIFVVLGQAFARGLESPGEAPQLFATAASVSLLIVGTYYFAQIELVRASIRTWLVAVLSAIFAAPWISGLLWSSYLDQWGVPDQAFSPSVSMRFQVVLPYAAMFFGTVIVIASVVGWLHYFRVVPLIGDAWMRVWTAVFAFLACGVLVATVLESGSSQMRV